MKKIQSEADRKQHFGIRKFSVGVASVLLSTTLYFGTAFVSSNNVLADTVKTSAENSNSNIQNTSDPGPEDTINSQKADETNKSENTETTTAIQQDSKLTNSEETADLIISKKYSKKIKLDNANLNLAVKTQTSNDEENQEDNTDLTVPVDTGDNSNPINNAETKGKDKLDQGDLKISDPKDRNFEKYQKIVDRYNGEEKSSQYVFRVIYDKHINANIVWTAERKNPQKNVYAYVIRNGQIDHNYSGQVDIKGENVSFGEYGAYGWYHYTVGGNYQPSSDGISSSIETFDEGSIGLKEIYGLGANISSEASAIGDIVPDRKQAVIRYLYKDPVTGVLKRLRNPIVSDDGLTGQNFTIKNVSHYQLDIPGYHLDKELSSNSSYDDSYTGTFSQFDQGKWYKKYYTSSNETVFYHQIDAQGTMTVYFASGDYNDYDSKVPEPAKMLLIRPDGSFADANGNNYGEYLNGNNHNYLTTDDNLWASSRYVEKNDDIKFFNKLKAGQSGIIISLDPNGYYEFTTMSVRNPYVEGKHAFQFVYVPDKQNAKVVYRDLDNVDANGNYKELETSNKLTGYSDQALNYNSKDSIQNWKKQGYSLVQDNTINQKFDHDSTKDQIFYVDFKHDVIKSRTESVTKNLTVHYVYSDGTKAAEDKSAKSIEFTRDVNYDKVTKKTRYGNWTEDQTFETIKSPVIKGYTPDHFEISNVSVSNTDKNIIEKTVTYKPNAQKLAVEFIDDTTGKTIKTVQKNGVSDAQTDYSTKNDINSYKAQHYELVSDSTNGTKLIFDNDDNSDQIFYVHLKHDIRDTKPGDKTKNGDNVALTGNSQAVIHYVYKNGTTAAEDNVQIVKFTRTGKTDAVTGQVIKLNPWIADKSFISISSPEISGYTADQKEVFPAASMMPEEKAQEYTVVYSPDAQEAMVDYIDDTTGQVIAQSSILKGFTDEKINYNTDQTIKSLKNEGYELVSDDMANANLKFDNNADTDQLFFVHLKHRTTDVKRNADVTMTVHYVYENGSKAQDDNIQTVHFAETGVTDNVTKQTKWNDVGAQNFTDVISPLITGYNPDKQSIAGKSVNFGNADIKVTVTYKANTENADITYIDDVTGENLKQDKVSGKFNTQIQFNIKPSKQIEDYENQGYKLVSNSFNNDCYKEGKNEFVVHLSHKTKTNERNNNITRIIHYIYENGQTAKSDIKQELSFTETGTKDLVTGKTEWNSADEQYFGEVKTPAITGFTPDKNEVKTTGVKFDSKDLEETITYHANNQNAKIIYIDDTAKKNLASDSSTGKFNQVITFDKNINDRIKDYEEQGYKLVSNNFNNQKFQSNNDENQFEVHFIHNMQKITATDDVNKTIHYIFEDNRQAKPDAIQKVSFTKSGVKDLVTGNIAWDDVDGQSFVDVATQEIEGYTADKSTVKGEAVHFGDKDIEATVTYKANPEKVHLIIRDDDHKKDLEHDDVLGETNKDIDLSKTKETFRELVENEGFQFINFKDETGSRTKKSEFLDELLTGKKEEVQKFHGKFGRHEQFFVIHLRHTKQRAMVEYLDDTTNKVIANSTLLNGKSGDKINYSSDKIITQLRDEGYELVSDDTVQKPFVFDLDNKSDQVFFVHLKHGIRDTRPGDKTENGDSIVLTGEAKAIIHYVDKDGNKVADDNVQIIKFSRTGKTDAVTGKIIELGPWIADKPFASITSPEISGYTADQKEVLPATPMSPEEDAQEYIVVYTKNEQGSEEHHDNGDNDQPDTPVENPTSGDSDEFDDPSNWKEDQAEKDTYTEEYDNSRYVHKNKVSKNVRKISRTVRGRDVIGKPTNEPIAATVHNLGKKQTQAELPQTGEKQDKAGLIGLAFASIAGLIGLAGKRRKNK